MTLFATTIIAAGLLLGTQTAQAVSIPLSGTIDSATLSSGIGTYTPVLATTSYSGLIATNSANQFFISLDLPRFTSNGPGCEVADSGCGPFASDGHFTVTDTGVSFSSHSFSQSGAVLTFSVFNAPEGSISGTLNLDTHEGHIAADVYAGQAFRADNRANLLADMSVSAVPLPGAAPLFGGALLVVAAVDRTARRRSASTA